MKLARCEAGWCESLWIGPAADSAAAGGDPAAGSERCTEIVWSRDGERVGFVINGQQLRLYDAGTERPAGLIDLVPRDADPSTRMRAG